MYLLGNGVHVLCYWVEGMLINASVVHVFLYITIILHNLVICLFPASIVPVADLLMGKFNIRLQFQRMML